ncbi:MAG: hypothetical protein KJ566_00845 [Nanoarchaeota archaeon]|nr:hypothetical protein [Nanoarchaeota archaeon]
MEQSSFNIKDIERGLNEISKHNGFDWEYWIIPLIKLYFEGRKNARKR